MKLRNKRTGEIATVEGFGSTEGEIQMTYTIDNDETKLYLYCTPSLTTFNEEWEDYKEPKEYWHIFGTNITKTQECLDELYDKRNKEIGNYFLSREEAEKAVRKLQAWKRLKDKGFRFTGCSLPSDKGMCICYETDIETWSMQDLQDFKTLFGGEEW